MRLGLLPDCFHACAATDSPTFPSWNVSRSTCDVTNITLTPPSTPVFGPGSVVILNVCTSAPNTSIKITLNSAGGSCSKKVNLGDCL